MSSKPPPDASDIDIESGVGARSGLGYVQLRWGPMGGQLTTREARVHAYKILDAAAAADHDASVWRWLKGRMGMSDGGAAAVLQHLRETRNEIDEASGNA